MWKSNIYKPSIITFSNTCMLHQFKYSPPNENIYQWHSHFITTYLFDVTKLFTEKLMQHSMKTLEFLVCRTGLVVWNLLLLCGIIWSTLLDCHNSGWTIDFANGFSLWHNQTLMQQLLFSLWTGFNRNLRVNCDDANLIIIGDIRGCHNDNLWCHQWWQSWYHDNSLFSVFTV